MHENMEFWQERVDLAAAFRWTARLNMHEGVANHFSLSINDDGTKFLMNPNQVHFSRIKASDMIVVDANDPDTLTGWPHSPTATCRPSTKTPARFTNGMWLMKTTVVWRSKKRAHAVRPCCRTPRIKSWSWAIMAS